MQPYRVAEGPRAKVTFPDEHRRAWTLLAFALIASSVGMVVAWLHSGGKISGSVLVPAMFGVIMLARPRLASLEYVRDAGELVVVRRTLVTRRTLRVPAGDITGVTVEPTDWKSENPSFELRLMLKHDKSVLLARASSAQALESARVLAGDFLVENRLLHDEREANVRIDVTRESDHAARNSLNPEPEAGEPSSEPSHVKPTKPP